MLAENRGDTSENHVLMNFGNVVGFAVGGQRFLAGAPCHVMHVDPSARCESFETAGERGFELLPELSCRGRR